MNTTKMLENVRCEKDLGVLTDHKLNFDLHIAEKKKLNSMLAFIKNCFMKLNCQSLSVLIETLVRPHLEYYNQAWHPDFQRHRSNLENAQRRATRLIPSLASLPFEQRLMKLDLPNLDFRRKRGRMIEVYKILNGVYDKRVTGGMLMENDRITRGNQRKLVVQPSRTSTRGNFFTVRAAKDWNSLPDDVTSAGTLDVFKAKLNNTWKKLKDEMTMEGETKQQ